MQDARRGFFWLACLRSHFLVFSLSAHGFESEDTEEETAEEKLDTENDEGGGGNQAAKVGAVGETLKAGLLPIKKGETEQRAANQCQSDAKNKTPLEGKDA